MMSNFYSVINCSKINRVKIYIAKCFEIVTLKFLRKVVSIKTREIRPKINN